MEVGKLQYGTGVNTSGFMAGLARMRAMGNSTGAAIGRSLSSIKMPVMKSPKFDMSGAKSAAASIATPFAAIGAGLGAVNVVKTAADLETRLTTLGKATDLSGSGLAAMKDELYTLSTTMAGVRLDALFDIATTGAKLGMQGPELMKFTKGIAMASTAIDDMPALEIADAMGGINSIFRLGGDGAIWMASAIDKIADSGAASASGIINVTQRLAGYSKSVGISAEDTFALAGALLDTKTNPELASSALSQLVGSLSQVKGRAGYAKALGMEAGEFAKIVETEPMQAIDMFLKRLGEMNDMGRTAALEGIGVEGFQRGGELKKLIQMRDSLGKYRGFAAEERKSPNQINKSYAATAGTTNAQLDRFNNQIQIMKDQLGSQLLPVVNSALPMIASFAARLQGAFMGAWATISGFVSKIPGYLTTFRESLDSIFGEGAVGKVLTFAGSFAGIMVAVPILTAMAGGLLTVFGSVVALFASGPALIATLGAGIMYLTGTTISLTEVFSTIGVAFRNLGSFGQIALLSIGAKFQNLIAYASAFMTNLGIVAQFVGSNWLELMQAPFLVLANVINQTAEAVRRFWANPTQGLQFNVQAMLKPASDVMAKLPEFVSAQLVDVQPQINEIVNSVVAKETGATAAQKVAAGAAATELVGPPAPTKAGEGVAKTGTAGVSVVEKLKFAGAATLGSKESHDTLSAAMAGRSGSSPTKNLEKDQVRLHKDGNKKLERVARAVEAKKSDLAVVNL